MFRGLKRGCLPGRSEATRSSKQKFSDMRQMLLVAAELKASIDEAVVVKTEDVAMGTNDAGEVLTRKELHVVENYGEMFQRGTQECKVVAPSNWKRSHQQFIKKFEDETNHGSNGMEYHTYSFSSPWIMMAKDNRAGMPTEETIQAKMEFGPEGRMMFLVATEAARAQKSVKDRSCVILVERTDIPAVHGGSVEHFWQTFHDFIEEEYHQDRELKHVPTHSRFVLRAIGDVPCAAIVSNTSCAIFEVQRPWAKMIWCQKKIASRQPSICKK